MSTGTAKGANLPTRFGYRPLTTATTPHVQLDQYAPRALQEELWTRMTGLPGVTSGRSGVSFPQTRAVHLAPDLAHGPDDAFMVRTEFAHLHGDGSGSLHVALPPERAAEAIQTGWAEEHPVVTMGLGPETWVMLYGTKNDTGLGVIWQLVQDSYAFACGQTSLPAA
ncbi:MULTISPECIES: luciferase family protein [Streptomyces]|uniref:luciferase domain-containing protein n=1 Tax=Streptomyces lycopersici TaxID=2974589 RepID=UPI0021D06525|nr:luciferase family protein [Streptomyces sp. NEAU-383]